MTPIDQAELGQAIARRRKRLRLTQQELADLAGCSRLFVLNLEDGKKTVRLDLVLGVLGALGLTFCLANGPAPLSAEAGLE